MVFFYSCLFILKPFEGSTQPHLINFDHQCFWIKIYAQSSIDMYEPTCREQIGGTIGRVLEVDVPNDGVGWGSFL